MFLQTGAPQPSQCLSEFHRFLSQYKIRRWTADCSMKCWNRYYDKFINFHLTVGITHKRQLFGFGIRGSARNFLSIMVQVSATTFILSLSMNLASSPHIQAINTVSETDETSSKFFLWKWRQTNLCKMSKFSGTTSVLWARRSRPPCSIGWWSQRSRDWGKGRHTRERSCSLSRTPVCWRSPASPSGGAGRMCWDCFEWDLNQDHKVKQTIWLFI